ncbi:MAG: hypothetical protein J3K34DRAFT_458740, partial [Monoraphidium minutum]
MGIVAGRDLDRDKAEFCAYWRRCMLELALLVHSHKVGAPNAETRLRKKMFEMGVRFGALLLHKPWAFEALMFQLLTKWWRSTMQ